jgi:hypothetical protein
VEWLKRVKHLPNKCEALSSNTCTAKKEKKEKKKPDKRKSDFTSGDPSEN